MRLALAAVTAALFVSSDLSAAANPGMHVLVVGDSIACGLGPLLQSIASHDSSKVEVECKEGTHISDWNDGRLEEHVMHMPDYPDALVVFLGTNDSTEHKAPDVHRILRVARDYRLPCVWVGPTDVGGKQAPLNGPLEDAVRTQCSYLNVNEAQIPLRADKVHPSPAGAWKLSKLVWAGLRLVVFPPKE